MTYKELKDTYLKGRGNLTSILVHSDEFGLEDWRVSNLLEKEGLFGKVLYSILEDIKRVERRDTTILLTSKKVGVDKSMVQFNLEYLRGYVEEIEERLTLSDVDLKDTREAIVSYHHSLNRIDDILEDLNFGGLLMEKRK